MFGLPLSVIIAIIEAAPTIIADAEKIGQDAGPIFKYFASHVASLKSDGAAHTDAIFEVAHMFSTTNWTDDEMQRWWDRAGNVADK
jgi:hypothetical protein